MLSISVLKVAFGSPNVVVYGDDFVYDERGDKCVHAQ